MRSLRRKVKKAKLWILLPGVVLSLLAGTPANSQGRKPQETSSEKISDVFQEVKEKMNRRLDDLDHGIHKALRSVKKSTGNALDALDENIQKLLKRA